MEPKCVILLVLFLFISDQVRGIPDFKQLETVDSLLVNIANEQWDQTEAACLQDTTALLNGVRNQTFWASWVWNSMQLPVGTFYGSMYHLGNFDQCLQVPWSSSHPHLQMQYCLVDVKLTELRKYAGELTDPYSNARRYIEMESSRATRFNRLFLGVCLPATCKPGSIAKIYRHIHRLSHLPLKDIAVDPRDCQVAGQKLERAPEFYVFWYVILFMTSVCFAVYYMGNIQDSHSTVTKILGCFCLTRNFDALTKTTKDDVKMMHGMRAITAGALVVMHYIIMDRVSFVNHHNSEKDFKGKYGRLLLHLDASVDTFLVMSGLLHFKEILSSKTSKPFQILCKRYLRLLTPFAFSVICYAYVLPHLGSGPAWPRLTRQYHQPCAKSWWKNLLMLGNKVDDRQFCMPVSWYIHCDYQLTVLGTLIFLLYRRSKKSALVTAAITYFLSVIISTFLNYKNGNPGILFYDFRESRNVGYNKVYASVYVHSYTRATSYLIGMAMGYLMTIYKPQEYRKVISKGSSITGFIFGFSLMLLVLQMGANLFEKQYTAMTMAIFAALDRSIWAVGICVIIAVCEYGTVPVVNDFLSSKVFVPLSKLSYVVYLCHTVFLDRNIFSLRAPPTYDIIHMIIDGLGYIVISFCFSYLFWLFVEGPVINLVNLAFRNRTTRVSQNGGVQNIAVNHNGIHNGVTGVHNYISGVNSVHCSVNGVKHEKIL